MGIRGRRDAVPCGPPLTAGVRCWRARSITPCIFTQAGGLRWSLDERETTVAVVGIPASPPGARAGRRPRGGAGVAARVLEERRPAGLTHLTTHWSRRATVSIVGRRGAVPCGPLLTAGVRWPAQRVAGGARCPRTEVGWVPVGLGARAGRGRCPGLSRAPWDRDRVAKAGTPYPNLTY